MDGGCSMARLEDMLQKIMRRFDANDEHTRELRGDLANIRQNVDAHAVSIKYLELQLTQLSNIMHPHQPVTLPSNNIQNPQK